MYQKKSVNSYWYVFALVNILPLAAVLSGIAEMHAAFYFYWAECALVAVLALALYARYLIVFLMMCMAVGLIVYIANPGLMENFKPVLTFWSLYSICWLAYIETVRSDYGKYLRKQKPANQVIAYFVFLAAAIILCFTLTNFIYQGPQFTDKNTFYMTFACIALLVPSLSTAMLKIIDMIGEKHFIDFLLGTYHRPQERNSIVLFLDMVDSSAMAEKLTAKESMKLIAQFIYDCGYIFRVNGGDILNYTGDGLVVIWPRNSPDRVLAAVHNMHTHFLSKKVKSEYWKKFGIVPEFRIGIHAGPVVIAQLGEEKLFLGLYGDVVNTAARLEQMNKELGTTILLSLEVTHGMNQSWKTLLKPLGKKEIRGRDEPVAVFTVYENV